MIRKRLKSLTTQLGNPVPPRYPMRIAIGVVSGLAAVFTVFRKVIPETKAVDESFSSVHNPPIEKVTLVGLEPTVSLFDRETTASEAAGYTISLTGSWSQHSDQRRPSPSRGAMLSSTPYCELPRKGSNLRYNVQSVACYHYTTG